MAFGLRSRIACLKAILFLAALQPAVGQQTAPTTPTEASLPVVGRVRAALEKKVTFKWEDVPLGEFAQRLRDSFEVSVSIDEVAVREQQPRSDVLTIAASDLRGMRLRTMLDLVLKPHALTWVERDDVLLITTVESAREMTETRVYDVTDILTASDTFGEDMIDLIQSTVAPTTWSNVGGMGYMKLYQNEKVRALVVLQDSRTHVEVTAFLDTLRDPQKLPPERVSVAPARPIVTAAFATAPDPQRDAVVAGNTQFALSLFGKLRERQGNLLVSPHNVSAALAMAYAGARGETAREMAKALHWPMPESELHSGFRALTNAYEKLDGPMGYKLQLANRLWCAHSLKPQDAFLRITRENYGAEAAVVDFRESNAQQIINNWIAAHTDGAIANLLPEAPPPDAAIVLTTAVRFFGPWETPFNQGATKQRSFDLGESLIEVPFMEQTAKHRYAEIDGVQILEKPYVGNALSMVVLLPSPKRDALEELESSLTTARLSALLAAMKLQKVHVQLPRFKFTGHLELTAALEQLGMRSLFSDAAEFGGIAETTLPIFIARVLHEAAIDVAEEGTKASAATAVIGGFGAFQPPEPQFFANRPFVFLIRDVRTQSVLFIGRLAKPESGPRQGS